MWEVAGGLVGAGLNYLGGKKAADALGQQGALMQAAGQKAADMATFKPVAMTNVFGSTTGEGGYQVSPEIAALQQQISGLYGGSLGQAEQAAAMMPQFQEAAQGLFGLGQQYLAQSPEEARQQYMSEQMAALRPYDIEEEERLGRSVFGRGRGGLSVGAAGQPELATLSEARSRRNLQLAAAADQAAQQRIAFGAGLFGTGAETLGAGYGIQSASLKPTSDLLALQYATQQPARELYQDALREAQMKSAIGATQGELYLKGALPSAQSYGMQGGVRGGMLMGLGQGIGGLFSGFNQPSASSNPFDIGLAGGGTFRQGSTRGPNTGGYSY
jgi:hypothetical protein